jgi:hypothetical protein
MTGRRADVVDLEVVIDAPFAGIKESRAKMHPRVDEDVVYHRTSFTADASGTTELRVSVFSAGRLVQALPIQLVVDTAEAHR